MELQIRTLLQHAWATAVETMGTFLNHALKSSEGPEEWLKFFSLSGSAFAHLEKTPGVPGYEDLSEKDTLGAVVDEARKLDVRDRLFAYSVAAERVHADRKSGSYHLIILDLNQKSVTIRTYSQSNLEIASKDYSEVEESINKGKLLQAVLVSAGSVENLRSAYPNYFLDTHEFVRQLNNIEKLVSKNPKK